MSKEEILTEQFDFFPFEESGAGQFPVPAENFQRISFEAFKRLSFTFTKGHLEKLINACRNPGASDNDRYVLSCLLKNAAVSSEGIFPLCQDTGIATVFGWKKDGFQLKKGGASLHEELSEGAEKLYAEKKLRFSTTCPENFYDEKDPKNNMPAQISIFHEDCSLAPLPPFVKNSPEDSFSLIFCAKGGGSSNKTSFEQGTKASLTKKAMTAFLKDKISRLGTSACPPYTFAVVAGGLSPEQNLLTLKLATMGAYDEMTYTPNPDGFRDRELEEEALKIARETGYGAQFGGTQFALEAVVIRLPRHGASCPLSAGVSCSAHRNLRAVVTKDGFYLEKTVSRPESLPFFEECMKFLDKDNSNSDGGKVIDTENGMKSTLAQLDGLKCGTRILLNGKILVARDAAHARWQKLLDEGKPLPKYTSLYPVCYAGPARTPDGKIIGSFGPTTAGRMDGYGKALMEKGAALVTLAKGNRSAFWKECCKTYGGFYLGTPGGIAALIASKYIISQKIIDYEDLGMEAVRIVEVRNLPCFVITDNRGNDFYGQMQS